MVFILYSSGAFFRLLLYEAIACCEDQVIVSNGAQTGLIYNTLLEGMQSPSEDGGKDPPNAKQAHQNISYLIDEWVSPQHILNKLRDHIFELDAEHILRSMEINGYSMINIFDYLSQSERKIYDCINNFLEEMKKHHDVANIMKTRYQTYVYDATEYLGAPYNLDYPIYVNYFQLCLHDLITMVGKKYLGSDNIYMFNNYLSLLYCGKHKSTRVKSQNWHRDPDGRRLFKFFIFMNDASETNGALEYIPRSQFTSTNRSTTVYDYGESFFGGGYPSKIMGPELGEFQELADKHGTVMTCPAGTLLFVDTSGFHRAGVSQPGKYRKYLVGQFRTLHDLGLLEAYHKQSTLKYPDCHYKGFNFSANYCVSPDKVESILGPIGKYFYYPSKQSCTLTHPPTFFCQKHPLDVPNIYQPFPVVATDETPEQRRLRIKQAVSARHRLKKGK